jgi:hypothetical protein
MGKGCARVAAVWSAVTVGALLGTIGAAEIAAQGPPPAVDVMLDEVGPGWELASEQPGNLGALTRTFRRPGAELTIIGFGVTDPPGVRPLFDALAQGDTDFTSVPEPDFELAAWLIPDGAAAPGDFGISALVLAADGYVFSFTLAIADADEIDGPALVSELARRQLDLAGGGPAPAETTVPREVDDAELLPFLPPSPPAGLGPSPASMTVSGANELDSQGVSSPETADFLNRRAKNVVRVWGSDLTAAVWITEYPYEIFAAAALQEMDVAGAAPLTVPAASIPRDGVAFDDAANSQVGVAFRSGNRIATVLVGYTDPDSHAGAVTIAQELAADVDDRLPNGATAPYDWPDPPSIVVGLLLTVVAVTAAVAGSRAVAWSRARRVRRRWAELEPPLPLPPPGSPPAHVIDLDPDAARLRHSGRWLAGVQLLTVQVGVVALAGDFGRPGIIVAASAFVIGLGFSRRWVRREHGVVGPSESERRFVRPRLPGVLVALVTFALLGVGVAFFMKGVRYLIFAPTLAQLRWADLFGMTPRAVGFLFTGGGLAATFVGAILYRWARSLSRAHARTVLASDARPPALYLRSFADDSLPLPTISTARRPLFELFSLRGADPFEESVAWELDSYAPVVAIGRPGGSLRSLGAAREHLAQASWHDDVAARMAQAGLVVLAPATTDGVEWELGEIVRGGHLSKTIFVFPPLPPTELAARWSHTADLLRTSGALVGWPATPWSEIHTVRVFGGGALHVTSASTRDEATYRTAVDRSVELAPRLQTAPSLVGATP